MKTLGLLLFCNNILQILGLSYKDMLVVLYDHSKGSGIIPSWLPQHLDTSKSPGISFTIQQVDEERSVYFQQTMSFVFQSARASLSVQMVSEFRWSTRKVFEDPASSGGQLSNKI